MNTLRTLAVCLLAGFAMVGCNSGFKDIKIDTETNPKVDFGGYDSYAWAAAAAVVRDPDREWTPPNVDIGAEIVHLVNRELRERGWTEVSTSPDVLVLYAVGVDMKALDVVVDEGETTYENVPQGGIMVVLADPESRRVMWIGSAVADLMEEPDEELGRKRLDWAITEMFKEMPR
jgi:hypothetical protein